MHLLRLPVHWVHEIWVYVTSLVITAYHLYHLQFLEWLVDHGFLKRYHLSNLFSPHIRINSCMHFYMRVFIGSFIICFFMCVFIQYACYLKKSRYFSEQFIVLIQKVRAVGCRVYNLQDNWRHAKFQMLQNKCSSSWMHEQVIICQIYRDILKFPEYFFTHCPGQINSPVIFQLYLKKIGSVLPSTFPSVIYEKVQGIWRELLSLHRYVLKKKPHHINLKISNLFLHSGLYLEQFLLCKTPILYN